MINRSCSASKKKEKGRDIPNDIDKLSRSEQTRMGWQRKTDYYAHVRGSTHKRSRNSGYSWILKPPPPHLRGPLEMDRPTHCMVQVGLWYPRKICSLFLFSRTRTNNGPDAHSRKCRTITRMFAQNEGVHFRRARPYLRFPARLHSLRAAFFTSLSMSAIKWCHVCACSRCPT